MALGEPAAIGGFVLAGGRSSRMGRDKATLDLGGKPLVARAVEKLRRVCAEVKVLSGDPGLEAYAPVVRDLHADCGPMGGMEAALSSSGFDWNLFLPVDVPFLPAAYLEEWVRGTLPGAEERGARVLMFMGGWDRAADAGAGASGGAAVSDGVARGGAVSPGSGAGGGGAGRSRCARGGSPRLASGSMRWGRRRAGCGSAT